jgi:hypothetical protein
MLYPVLVRRHYLAGFYPECRQVQPAEAQFPTTFPCGCLVDLQCLMAILGGRGCQVRSVRDVSMAQQMIGTAPPDLVLLDLAMPGIDVYQVCCGIACRKPPAASHWTW